MKPLIKTYSLDFNSINTVNTVSEKSQEIKRCRFTWEFIPSGNMVSIKLGYFEKFQKNVDLLRQAETGAS